jgi:nucleoside-diphosphate-sugar epimerase
VLHTASPLNFDVEGRVLEAIVKPAVNGTKNVFRSIQKAQTVQRVVLTSSISAIGESVIAFYAQEAECSAVDDRKPVPTVYTEDDWNEFSSAESARLGNDQPPEPAYRASKTLAERAAWEFVETNKPSWDLTTITPPLVFGPILHQVGPYERPVPADYLRWQGAASSDKLNLTTKIMSVFLHGGDPKTDLLKDEADLLKPSSPGNQVDVRDVALAHVLALTTPAAGGHRFAASKGQFSWQEVLDIVHASNSGAIPAEWKQRAPVGTPGAGKDLVQNTLRGDKAAEQLGLRYHSFTQTWVAFHGICPLAMLKHLCRVEDTIRALADYEKRGFKGYPSEEIIKL